MQIFSAQNKTYFKEAFHLTKKCSYKSLEFQLLFKTLYLTGILFVLNYIASLAIKLVDFLATASQTHATLGTSIIAFLDIQFLTTVIITALITIFVYLAEKNGLIYIAAHYRHNHYVTFFKSFFTSLARTPHIITVRLYELRSIIILLTIAYISWRALSYYDIFTATETGIFSTITALISAALFLLIIFRNTFTPYILCINAKESTQDFRKNLPKRFIGEKILMILMHYTFFFLTISVWLIVFFVITKFLVITSGFAPHTMSFVIAFFISLTIVSTLLILSFMKTFKISLITTLYYHERKRQNKPTLITPSPKKRFSTAVSFRKTIVLLTAALLIASTLLTTSIKNKTDTIIANAEKYVTSAEFTPTSLDAEELHETIIPAHDDDRKLTESVSRIVFSIFALIILE